MADFGVDGDQLLEGVQWEIPALEGVHWEIPAL